MRRRILIIMYKTGLSQILRKAHYSWAICALGTLTAFTTMGINTNGFSMYMPYLISVNEFSNTQTSMLITIRCLVAFIAMFFIGKYYSKLGLRKGISVSAALACLTFFIYGLAPNYMFFCIGAVVSGLSYGLGSMVPISMLINNWFARNKVMALGICTVGSSVASITMPIVITALIDATSIRISFIILSGLMFIATVVIAAFVCNKPEDKGLLPYGRKKARTVKVQKDAVKLSENHTLPMRIWFFGGAASVCLGIVSIPGFSHVAVLYTTAGFKPEYVAYIISGIGLILAVTKPTYGFVADHLGSLKASTLFSLILLSGFVASLFADTQNVTLAILCVILLGIGYPVGTISPSTWADYLAPKGAYPKVLRRFQMMFSGGALAFSSIPGILADIFGSYVPVYFIFSVFLLLSIIFVLLAFKTFDKMKAQKAVLEFQI